MKFDENGQRLIVKTGISVKELFLNEVKTDIKIIADYMKTDVPEVILKNGFGGDYNKSRKLVRIGLGTGNYNNRVRSVIVHEMLHHKGYGHGRVLGLKFMSHENNDQISPVLCGKIFNLTSDEAIKMARKSEIFV